MLDGCAYLHADFLLHLLPDLSPVADKHAES